MRSWILLFVESCLTLSLRRFSLHLRPLHQGWVVGHRDLVYAGTFSFHQSLVDESNLDAFIFVNVCALNFVGFLYV